MRVLLLVVVALWGTCAALRPGASDEALVPRAEPEPGTAALGWRFSPRATFPEGIELSESATNPPGWAETLWEKATTKELMQKALATKFVQGVAKGTLRPETYANLILQDAVYIAQSQDNFEIVAAKAPAGPLKQYFDKKIFSYLDYKQYMFGLWRIKSSEAVELSEAAQKYIQFQATVANMEEPHWYLLANYPCYHLWSYLASEAEGLSPAGNLYRPWIEENKSNSSSIKLSAMINQHYAVFGQDIKLAETIFATALAHEVALFESAQ